MAGSTTKDAVDILEVDISSQENVSRRASTSGRSNKQQIRHRASIACFSCRDRRIRCVVPKGGSGCIQCRRSGTECVIKMDDERRRPISKAYVSSLSARIALLEGMLREKGMAVPTATHPPMTKHETQGANSGDELRISAIEAQQSLKLDEGSPTHHVLSPPYSHEDFAMCESPIDELASTDILRSGRDPLRTEQSLFRAPDPIKDNTHRLFFPSGGLSCDRRSGKLRFFGPTANCHVYGESVRGHDPRESPEQVRRAERIIRSLTPQTHNYLMHNFWTYHNSVLQVVDRDTFESHRGLESPKYYSSFLHIILLAIGWRFADKDRYDIARMSLGNYESTIHREAKCMLEAELERPMGIPSIQSLLLLGDLECGVGRDHAGWMYDGMANRLAFDIGLHVNCKDTGLPDREISLRRRVMKACHLYDRYWALFLGRPTNIKNQDIDVDLYKSATPTIRSSERSSKAPADTRTIDEEIHEQLVELMDLASQMVELRGTDQTSSILTLNQQLQDWYGRLPGHLTWKSENIKTASCSYFLLHKQYHAIVILLHRSWEAHRLRCSSGPTSETASNRKDTKKAPGVPGKRRFSISDQEMDLQNLASLVANNHTKSAHTACTRAAIQFAQIVSQFKERYDTEKMCCTSLQPAGTAAIALLAAIASQSKDGADRRLYLSSLEVVTDAIQSMSRSYQPAAKMGNLIQALLSRVHPDARNARPSRDDSLEQDADGREGDGDPQCKDPQMLLFSQEHQKRCERDQLSRNGKYPHALPTHSVPHSAGPPSPFHMPTSPYGQNSLGHMNPIPGLLPSFPDTPGTGLFLDMLYDPGVEVDGAHASRYGSDTYLRVAPSAHGWGLHSLHATSHPEPHASPPSFDSHMSDWIAEPASLGNTTASPHEPVFGTQSGAGVDPEQQQQAPHSKSISTAGCKIEDTGSSLLWGFGSLTPAHSTRTDPSQPQHHHEGGSDFTAPPRNHELDFLSL